MSEVNSSCDCNRGCNTCEDYNICACHDGSEGRACKKIIGVVVTRRFGAPRYKDAPELLNLPHKPLRMACPPTHRKFCKNIFSLVEDGKEEDL